MQVQTMQRVRLSRRTLRREHDHFLRSLRNKRPETRGTYQRALREFMRWFDRERYFRFQVRDVERYKKYLAARKRLSAVSISTYLTAVRRFFGYLVRTGVLPLNPADQVEGNTPSREHSRDVISRREIDALLSSVDRGSERGLRDFAIVKLMVECALSEIEIVRADIGDLRESDGQPGLAVQGKGRIAKDDHVRLARDVQQAIDSYLAARGSCSARDPLFTSAGNRTRGKRMTTRGVRDRVNRYLVEAGIKTKERKNVTPFSLRHTAAVLMAQNGATAEEIRKHMRLGSSATAMLYVNYANRNQTPPN